MTEVGAPVEKVAGDFAASTDEFATWFKGGALELSGVDENEQPSLSARIYPVKSLHSRSRETSAFYESFDVPREVWFFQDTSYGPVVIGVTAMNAPDRTHEYAATDEKFASWFKQRVLEVTGVDPNVTPLGPPSEQVFNFEA